MEPSETLTACQAKTISSNTELHRRSAVGVASSVLEGSGILRSPPRPRSPAVVASLTAAGAASPASLRLADASSSAFRSRASSGEKHIPAP